METDILVTARQHLQSAYARPGESVTEEFLDTLLDVLLDLLRNCLGSRTPAAIAAAARNLSFRDRVVVRLSVRRWLRDMYGRGAWREYKGARIVDAILDVGMQAEPEQIEELCQAALEVQ